MPIKFCPHCGKKTGFQVKFDVSCRIDGKEAEGYLRICQECKGRFVTIREDERKEWIK